MQTLYREAKGRKEKSRLLDQVGETLGRGRRQAKRLMRGKEPRVERPFRKRGPIYSERLIRVLEQVWQATQNLWSVRLKAALPLWMFWIKKRWSLSVEEERLLLAMSPATMDRRLAPYKSRLSRKIYGQTKPGRWLRRTIPIQTESWDVREVGWTEVDTVSHSGPFAAGVFARTLNQVDLLSTWVGMRAILGKKAEDIVAAEEDLRQEFPFELKGMDSDNGEEFINYELDRYCHKTGVQRFRSRPYKKDDQAHIEQKNGTNVRRLVGWDRYDTQEAVDAMNDLYRNELRLLINLFLPSVKLANKIRVGSRTRRVYKDAKTPLDRLMESGQGDGKKIEELRRLRERLDPFALSRTVDHKLQAIWSLASRGRIKAAPTAYVPAQLRWQDLTRREDFPPALFTGQNRDIARIRKSWWRDHYYGTS
jgi:hypothetical protein